MFPSTKERRATPASERNSEIGLAFTRFATSAGDEGFNIRKAARQSAGHPFGAGVSYQHVVFDAHSDAFVLFKRDLHGSDKSFVFRCFWQIVQRVRPNVDARFVREHHARLEGSAAANIMDIHA